MSKQTRLCFLPSGELTYSSKDPLPDYPLLNHAPFWPKLCHNDNSILNTPKLNSKSHLLRFPRRGLTADPTGRCQSARRVLA